VDGLSWLIPALGNLNLGQLMLMLFALFMMQNAQSQKLKELTQSVATTSTQTGDKLARLEIEVVKLQAYNDAGSVRRAEDRENAAQHLKEITMAIQSINARLDKDRSH
jgi:predicted FMN-binding regulatory protein PaiB